MDDAAAAAEVASQPIVYLIPVAAEQQSAVFNPQSTEADEQSSAVEEQPVEQEGCSFDADVPPVAEDTSDDGNIKLEEQEYYQPPVAEDTSGLLFKRRHTVKWDIVTDRNFIRHHSDSK